MELSFPLIGLSDGKSPEVIANISLLYLLELVYNW